MTLLSEFCFFFNAFSLQAKFSNEHKFCRYFLSRLFLGEISKQYKFFGRERVEFRKIACKSF